MRHRDRAPLEDAAPLLRCPHCASDVTIAKGGVVCARAHRFDVARQGYVNFRVGRPSGGEGDTADMIAARDRFLEAGHYAPLAAALAEEAAGLVERCSDGAGILDLGAGTGYYAARALEAAPSGVGVAVDVSKAAARRAARAHPRLASVVADATRDLPLRGGAFAAVLSAFAPRDPDEIARVLERRGAWLVAAPRAEHLSDLASTLGLLGIDARKESRLLERARPKFALTAQRRVDIALTLSPETAEDLVRMGPSAFHISDDTLRERIAGLGPLPIRVPAAFVIYRFEPQGPPSRS